MKINLKTCYVFKRWISYKYHLNMNISEIWIEEKQNIL